MSRRLNGFSDTIVAPSTAVAPAGIAIVRLSGPIALSVMQQLFLSARSLTVFQPRYLYHGRLQTREGVHLDEIMAVFMPGPSSYTGDDVVEFHCHGSSQVVRALLDQCIDLGCRLAVPGEFTQRAFMNGRMDLSQAEAVMDLIHSRSEGARLIALQQLDGALHRIASEFRRELVDLLSLIETTIDFTEDDLDPIPTNSLIARARQLIERADVLLSGFDSGRVLREGASILLLGRPNAGKSSLLNALLGESRSIVTEIPGTTRDTIEEQLVLGNIPLRLIDSAGIRKTEDRVEAEGVARALERCERADLVLLLTDVSTPLSDDDLLAIHSCANRKVIAVRSKADLSHQSLPDILAQWPVVYVSPHTGEGLDDLRRMIIDFFLEPSRADAESFLLSDRRHREALQRMRTSCSVFLAALQADLAPELLAVDLRAALVALGEITGETTPDEILEQIFSRFCIGK